MGSTRGALAPEIHSRDIVLKVRALLSRICLELSGKRKENLRHPVNTSVCVCVRGGLLRDCAGEKGHWDLYPYPIRLRSPAFCKHLNAFPVPVTDFPGAKVSILKTHF